MTPCYLRRTCSLTQTSSNRRIEWTWWTLTTLVASTKAKIACLVVSSCITTCLIVCRLQALVELESSRHGKTPSRVQAEVYKSQSSTRRLSMSSWSKKALRKLYSRIKDWRSMRMVTFFWQTSWTTSLNCVTLTSASRLSSTTPLQIRCSLLRASTRFQKTSLSRSRIWILLNHCKSNSLDRKD